MGVASQYIATQSQVSSSVLALTSLIYADETPFSYTNNTLNDVFSGNIKSYSIANPAQYADFFIRAGVETIANGVASANTVTLTVEGTTVAQITGITKSMEFIVFLSWVTATKLAYTGLTITAGAEPLFKSGVITVAVNLDISFDYSGVVGPNVGSYCTINNLNFEIIGRKI